MIDVGHSPRLRHLLLPGLVRQVHRVGNLLVSIASAGYLGWEAGGGKLRCDEIPSFEVVASRIGGGIGLAMSLAAGPSPSSAEEKSCEDEAGEEGDGAEDGADDGSGGSDVFGRARSWCLSWKRRLIRGRG